MSVIQVQLINFKGVTHKVYNLPVTGIILFDGINGAGKTTLLEALSFALYDQAGNSCYPWNSKSNQVTSVQIIFPNGLNIYRQRRPNVFRVITSDGIDMVGDPAVAYIESRFGVSLGWLASGYIKQLTVCHFLTMTAAAKLEFLQKMFLPDPGKYERLLTKVNDKLSETNSQFQQVSTQRQVKEQLYLYLYNQLPENVRLMALWTEDFRTQFISDLGKQVDLTSQIEQAQRDLTLAISQNKSNEQINQQIDQLTTQRDEIPDSSELESQKSALIQSQSQLTLAKGIEKRNQLLIYRSKL